MLKKNTEKKIINDLNDIYSYILSTKEINKLAIDIYKLIENKSSKIKILNEKDVLLITYADSIKNKKNKSLEVLSKFLNNHIKKAFSILHILPFYPASSDGGFSVINFFKVNAIHGDWKHIRELSMNYRLMVDVVINHGSKKSLWFKNFIKGSGEGNDFFLYLDQDHNMEHIVRARSHKLLQKVYTKKGTKYLWCTFSPDQIDFDYKNPKVLLMFIKIIKFILLQGPSILRLDAVAFLWKRLESNCINLDQTHAVVRLIRTIIKNINANSLIVTETNLPFHENLSYFGNSDEAHIIYNFSLAPLIINTLIKGDSTAFRRWSMSMPPAKIGNSYINFLATHDGLGIRPLEGILNKKDLELFLQTLKSFGSRFSYRKHNKVARVYEANIALIDALSGTTKGKDNYTLERYLCAHAIMLSYEGLPAIYIHSLFGTRSDIKLYIKTKNKRSINRHIYNYSKLEKNIMSPKSETYQIFTKLKELIEIRKKQKAFHPNATQYTLNLSKNIYGIWRQSNDRKQSIFSISNITNKKIYFNFELINLINTEEWVDLLSNQSVNQFNKKVILKPYQTMWISNS